MKKMLNGIETEAHYIDIVLANEPWNEYTLANGTIVRVKHIVKAVIKFDAKNPDGSQAYGIEGQLVVDVRET